MAPWHDRQVTNYARVERLALCDTLLRTGPDAPTLCEGWATRDLAAHLVLREGRPDAQVGALVPALADRAAALQQRVSSGPYDDLVASVRTGPPVWHPSRLGPVDQLVNTAEFYVHHEDVLRAEPDWTTPRVIPEELQRTLWRTCQGVGRLALRKAPVGVELVADGYGSTVVRKGDPAVQVHGSPAELLLFVFGRRTAAQVRLDGPADAIAALRGSPSAM